MIKRNWPIFLLLLAFALYGFGTLLWGEHILANNGLGWDGQAYYWLSKNMLHYWEDRIISSYYALRVIPSLLVNIMHTVAGTEHTHQLTSANFGRLNLASILLGTVLLWRCLEGTSTLWRTIGIGALLSSFAFARMPFYYPILTDSFAFLIGALLLWGHQRNSFPIKAVATLLGAFTFPSTLVLALPLLVLRHSKGQSIPRRIETWLIVLCITIFIFLSLTGPAFRGGMPFDTVQPARWVVLLSIPFPLIYLIWLWRRYNGFPIPFNPKLHLNYRGAAVWGGIFTIVVLIVLWTRPATLPKGFAFMHIVDTGLLHPAVALVAHVSFFGPIMLIPLLFPRRFKEELEKLDMPLRWTAMLGLSMLVASESRTSIMILPLIILLCVRTLNNQSITTTGIAVLSLVAFLWSKVWFIINQGEMVGELLEFPRQRYFMHIGPWISTQAYLIQLAATIVTGRTLWLVLRRKKNAQ